jgi:ATP-binding cassette, subfamily B, bacterial
VTPPTGRLSSKARERRSRDYQSVAASQTQSSSNGEAASKWSGKRYLREYARWLYPYRWSILSVFLFALITAALDMVWPLAIKRIIDGLTIENGRNFSQLNVLCAAVVVLLIVKQAFDSYRNYRTAVLNAKVVFRLRKRLFRRLVGLSLGELSEMKAGGITSRLSGDVDSVSGLGRRATGSIPLRRKREREHRIRPSSRNEATDHRRCHAR